MTVDLDVRTQEEAELLKVLADPQRWRILHLLRHEELCVCHLVEELATSQPLVSHHLKVLREAGLVTSSRHRYWTYYRLAPAGLDTLAVRVAALAHASTESAPSRRPCCS